MERHVPEPRLVIAFDRLALEPWWLSVENDRVYFSVGTTESDVWVATVKR